MKGSSGNGGGMDPTVPLPGGGIPGHLPPPSDPWAEPTPVGPPPTAPPPTAPPPTAPPPTAPPPTAPPPVAPRPVAPPPAAPRQRTRANAPVRPGPADHPPTGATVAQIGEITVTSSSVHTPTGDLLLAGSVWQVSDYWQNEQRTPMWAVAAAIIGFAVLTFFSLLFLLVKETRHHGTVQVTVTSGQRQYVARIPVRTQDEVQRINQQVNYVRSLAVA